MCKTLKSLWGKWLWSASVIRCTWTPWLGALAERLGWGPGEAALFPALALACPTWQYREPIHMPNLMFHSCSSVQMAMQRKHIFIPNEKSFANKADITLDRGSGTGSAQAPSHLFRWWSCSCRYKLSAKQTMNGASSKGPYLGCRSIVGSEFTHRYRHFCLSLIPECSSKMY